VPHDDRIPDVILDELPRYFAGEPGASAAVEAWAARHPVHRRLLDDARRLWDAAAGRAPDGSEGCGDVDAAWARFQERVGGAGDAGGAGPAT
jgi:ferric-dicitrate binding protein FerR (iron transport regulator)